MRTLKVIEHMSLDGVVQSSGEDDFPYAEWTVPYRTPAGRDELLAAHGERFDLLLGRRTYDMWSDEVLLTVYPTLLGTGKRFFAPGTPARSFELVSTKAMPTGVILCNYKVVGPLKTA